ncbi:MAG TPA: hypothetical protein VHE61_00990 [Opitutaceae bacterium]|nr:hypothetical protein [Opitutaceae bacterium]
MSSSVRHCCVLIRRIALPIAVLSLLAGCASERGPRYGVATNDRDAVPPPPAPEMEAHGVFFGGQVDVDVVLNRAGFGPHGVRGGEAGGGGRHGGGSFAGFGGRGRRGFRGGEGGERREGGGGEESPSPHIVASNQPPVALHLRLTNHTSAPLVIQVPDFDSDLGNFVVQPDTVTVPPNGSADADPMTSRLGVTAAQIPLTVTLQINQRVDTQVLSLHLKPASAGPAAAAPGAPTPPTTPPPAVPPS